MARRRRHLSRENNRYCFLVMAGVMRASRMRGAIAPERAGSMLLRHR